MHPRTLVPALRGLYSSGRHRGPVRRPTVYVGAAAAGAVLLNVLVGTGPAASGVESEPQSVSVARQLGLDASTAPVDAAGDLGPLADLAASRSSREDAEVAAQFTQAAADRAVLDRQRAEAEAAAAAQRAAEEAAKHAAAQQAAAQQAAAQQAAAKYAADLRALAAAAQAKAAAAAPPAKAPAAKAPAAAVAQAAGSVAATLRAKITNTAGAIKPQAQAAADAVVSNVPGAGSITLGGTRASAVDPGGHPSGLAVDYMVLGNGALGDAIVAYHVAHWNELGVDYLIYKQRMLSSTGGAWQPMADRGSPTANHMDHVHVNYR
jgi:hypothetical protein